MNAAENTTSDTMTTEPVRATFRVPDENLASLQAGIEKLNKRVRKLGGTDVVVNVLGHEDVKLEMKKGSSITLLDHDDAVEFFDKIERYRRYHTVEIVGEVPSVRGYTFAATLEYIEGEVMTRVSPMFSGELPKHFRDSNPELCDHCRTRRQRHETFVLRRNDGSASFIQLGRNCLADFFPGIDPKNLAARAEMLLSAMDLGKAGEEEPSSGGGGSSNILGLHSFLMMVAMVIRKNGWMSAKRAYEREVPSTAGLARSIIYAGPKQAEEWRNKGYVPTAEDAELATKSIEWARETFGGKEQDARSDYEHNAYVATKGEAVGGKSTGIAASVVAGYMRFIDDEKIRNLGPAADVHVGTVGKRDNFYVRVVGTRRIESEQWGLSTLVMLRTRDNVSLKWFASGAPELPDHGVEVRISASVKKHDVYEGKKQTLVNRVVIWTPEAIEAEAAKAAKKAEREAKKAAKAAAKAAKEAK
jgi:hypothetical protein